jgi:hypothetical protein
VIALLEALGIDDWLELVLHLEVFVGVPFVAWGLPLILDWWKVQ